MSRIWDISPEISPDSVVFSEDVPFSQDFGLHVDRGDHLTISSIRTTVHVEAHADAPVHYLKGGESIASRDPRIYLGACQVVRTEVSGRAVTVDDLGDATIEAPRLLIRTAGPHGWDGEFSWLDGDLIRVLHDKGVKLIGIDTPSVDSRSSKDLATHHVIAGLDMAILEGLDLEKVPAGIYTLSALPLKIRDADASPVRAVLVERDDPLD